MVHFSQLNKNRKRLLTEGASVNKELLTEGALVDKKLSTEGILVNKKLLTVQVIFNCRLAKRTASFISLSTYMRLLLIAACYW